MLTIDQLREKVRQTDASIIKKLAQRQELVKEIGYLKTQEGKAIVDLDQEKKLFNFYKDLAEEYNLQHDFVQNLFKVIIDYSRMVQQL